MTVLLPTPILGIVSLLLGSEPAASVWAILLLIVLGLLAIIKGGDMFTDSSVHIARITKVPPLIVGATIVSMATSFPEFMVSLTGALSGATEFAVGNVVGSYLCNIGLIVGSCAIVRSYIAKRSNTASGISASREMLAGPGIFMLVTAAVTCVFSWFDSGTEGVPFGISRWQAVVLLIGMFWYLAYSVRQAKQARHETSLADQTNEPKVTFADIGLTTFTFLLACGVVVLGSRLLVTNGESLANMLGVPQLVLGLTLFAMGTSLPEFTISMIAVLKGHEALGIGNIIGSNVLNICWVLASCALIRPLPISAQTVYVDLPVTMLLTVMLVTLPWKNERITTGIGWALLAVYTVHLVGVTVASMV